MNHKRLLSRIASLFLVMLVSAACGAAQPTLTPVPPTATPVPATTTPVPATPAAVSQDVVAEIDVMLDKMAKQALFTGSVLIGQRGEVLLAQGYGLADRVQGIPNTSQTRFRLASITKQFTAMAILILESQGKLKVEDPICNYIPDCPSTWNSITIDHLLTHTSGIPDFMASPDFPSIAATPSAPVQTIARFRDLPLDFEPGESWSYSNCGYVVLGYIIEQVSGQTYEDFLQHSIFTPLKLRDTGYDHNSNSLAVGYPDAYSSPNHTQPAEFIDMSIPYAAGGLYSTVEDLYRWEQALSTEQLVPQAYLDEMFAPHAAIPDGGGWAYGYGWFVGTDQGGRPTDRHPGYLSGFASVIARYPDNGITIIVLSNQQGKDVSSILDILSKKILGDK